MSDTFELPNGKDFALGMPYTSNEANGVLVLVVTSCISLTAVFFLLVVISLSAFNTRKSTDQNLFVRTHVAAYLISLLVCDLMQAVGSIMNMKWVQHMEVYVGSLCTIQGIIKHTSDVGTALFSLVIAIHTFCVLFLRWKMRNYVLWLTLISAWSAIATLVIAGPAALDTVRRGPFFGIAGYWCWISPGYATERITLDYMIMFISAILSFILYSLVFLRLRGNIIVSGWYIAFRRANNVKNAPWRGHESTDNHMIIIAKKMLLYPVAYTIVILPISAARFTAFSGKKVPFAATIFCATVFLLSGTINVILFTSTRRILPPKSIFPKFSISRPKPVTTSFGDDPEAYYRSTDPNEQKETPTSVFKRAESYVSDGGSEGSLPMEHGEEPVQPLDHAQLTALALPMTFQETPRASMESIYSDPGSEILHITDDEDGDSNQHPSQPSDRHHRSDEHHPHAGEYDSETPRLSNVMLNDQRGAHPR